MIAEIAKVAIVPTWQEVLDTGEIQTVLEGCLATATMYYSTPSAGLCSTSRYRMIGAVSAALIFLYSLWHFQWRTSDPPRQISFEDAFETTSLEATPQRRMNVAIASRFEFHFDVYMTVAWTLQRVMNGGKVQVYTPGAFGYDFQTIVEKYSLYKGTYKDYTTLTQDVIDGSGDGGIDLIVFGTCELDMNYWSEKLLAAWDARDAAHKFQIVCIVHNFGHRPWQSAIPAWSRRNAIRLLPISAHVGKTFRKQFEDLARSSSPANRSAGYEYIPIDTHVPIIDIPNLPDRPSTSRPISNVVIQGFFDPRRRDYIRIFNDLNNSMHAEPESWGYLPRGDNPSFVEDTTSDAPPFKLHLVGSGDVHNINVPSELRDVIVFHTGQNYGDFYSLMSTMDACVPAFKSETDQNFRLQASSSITMCMETNVPILAVHELRESYLHVDDDRITINRPAVMTELSAIKALRTGDTSRLLASDPSSSGITLGSHPRIREAVLRLVREGWVRDKAGFDACKRRTWRENEVVMMKILRDQP